jgi:predicted house-cleaning noncanonical NTP pyrophosphatase (MazG superfamily)
VTGKLVRDGIPGIVRARGGMPLTRVAEPSEYAALLRAKLTEEAGEAAAAGRHELAGELADVLEVVTAIADDAGLSPQDLEAARAAKAASRGGFAGRIVWTGNEGEPALAHAAHWPWGPTVPSRAAHLEAGQ